MNWFRLQSSHFGASPRTPGVDPALVWADATLFRDYRRPGDPEPSMISVIVELKHGKVPRDLQADMRAADGYVLPIYLAKATRFCTAEFTAPYCTAVLAGLSGQMIERFELQMPVIPQRPRLRRAATPSDPPAPVHAAGRLLLGVIDSGCAFAGNPLRSATDGTRVISLWDQDEGLLRAGERPTTFRYGREATRPVLDRAMRNRTVAGVVDEQGTYEDVGYIDLRERFTHGAAVTDLLCGPHPLASRLRADPDLLPDWSVVQDAAAKADLVFVQLSRDAVQDSSSGVIAKSILDGLHHILGYADAAKRVIVSISNGSSRGAHDGRSIIEQAMLELITTERAQRELAIVIAAANSYDEMRHAQFDRLEREAVGALSLFLQPECEAPSWVVVSIPREAKLEIALQAPGDSRGSPFFVKQGEAFGWSALPGLEPACGIVFPEPAPGERGLALLCFAPTRVVGATDVSAPIGTWTIRLKALAEIAEPVHLFVSRNQNNPGSLSRGRQAHFVDVDGTYDPKRAEREREVDPVPPCSPIRRKGTLSSLATAPIALGVYVVGSKQLRDGQRSRYSSEGPSVDVHTGRGDVLDGYEVTDVSRNVAGITASGTRSGEVVSIMGTSFAVPQFARALANLR